jgi:hypothetical protein
VCAGAREEIQKAKPMTRDSGSWSGSRYLGTKRSRRLQNKEVAAARLTSYLYDFRLQGLYVQETLYKPFEELLLEAGTRENAFSVQTPIKMSVLAAVRGSSFQP